MDNATDFLKRNLDSILSQTFKDYEIVISDDSEDDLLKIWLKRYSVKYFRNKGPKGMANNTNNAIENASGKLIKILFQDDFFSHEKALAEINTAFKDKDMWLVTACTHTTGNNHEPFYSETENTIGSPSVLTFRKEVEERFDPEFHWVLDLDLYRRLFNNYGHPKILHKINVVIGLGSHQTTHKLSEKRKQLEYEMLRRKYEKD